MELGLDFVQRLGKQICALQIRIKGGEVIGPKDRERECWNYGTFVPNPVGSLTLLFKLLSEVRTHDLTNTNACLFTITGNWTSQYRTIYVKVSNIKYRM